MVQHTTTHIGRLREELSKAAGALALFEDFRSPVNHAVIAALWGAKGENEIIQVAVQEYTGTFYRGRILEPSAREGWVVLADDNDLVPGVTADMFVSVRLVPKP